MTKKINKLGVGIVVEMNLDMLFHLKKLNTIGRDP